MGFITGGWKSMDSHLPNIKLLELVEMEIRETLDKYEFDGEATPIIQGSALMALEGKNDDIGKNAIAELMAAVDEHIPVGNLPVDGDFYMPIEGVFSIAGRGTVATGRVERGRVRIGDPVEIVGMKV